jgi:hypothetical protein
VCQTPEKSTAFRGLGNPQTLVLDDMLDVHVGVLKPTGGRTPWSMPGGPGAGREATEFAGVLKGAVNSQPDSTDRQFFKLRVDLAGFDDIADLESPRPEIRFLCWHHRVLDAFVEHEKSPNIVNEIGSQAWLADVLVHINEHAIRGWMSFCPGTDDANLSP